MKKKFLFPVLIFSLFIIPMAEAGGGRDASQSDSPLETGAEEAGEKGVPWGPGEEGEAEKPETPSPADGEGAASREPKSGPSGQVADSNGGAGEKGVSWEPESGPSGQVADSNGGAGEKGVSWEPESGPSGQVADSNGGAGERRVPWGSEELGETGNIWDPAKTIIPGREDTGKPAPIKVAIIKFFGEPESVNSPYFDSVMRETRNLDGKYDPLSVNLPSNSEDLMPDSPPVDIERPDGTRFALTGELYHDTDAEEYHLQLWLWDMSGDTSLIYTDELVCGDFDEGDMYIPAMVKWIFDHIIIPTAPPVVEGEIVVIPAGPVERPPMIYEYNTLTFFPGIAVFNPGPKTVPEVMLLGLEPKIEPIGYLSFQYNLEEKLGFRVQIDRDAVLLNRVFLIGGIRLGPAILELGPFLGMFNDAEAGKINPGLSLSLGINRPWGTALSAAFRMDLSFGRLGTKGAYQQDMVEGKFGYTFGSIFELGFTATSKIFTRDLGEAGSVQLVSDLTRYNLSGRFVHRNFTLGLHGGYQVLSQTRSAILATPYYSYSNIYAGLEGSVRFLTNWEMLLYLEAPVYPWEYYLGDFTQPYLLTGNLGVRFSW